MGVVVWVGGMFFAHMALRPSVQSLAPPERLSLLAATLSRFLAWAGVAVVAILASGFAMMAMMGGSRRPIAGLHAMTAVGLVDDGHLRCTSSQFPCARCAPRVAGGGLAARGAPRCSACAISSRSTSRSESSVIAFGVLARG